MIDNFESMPSVGQVLVKQLVKKRNAEDAYIAVPMNLGASTSALNFAAIQSPVMGIRCA